MFQNILREFQSYIILRDYFHSKLRLEEHYPFFKTFALSAAKLLVPLALIASVALAAISMAFGFTIFGTIFAIIFASICYGMQIQRVYLNELILMIGIPMSVINGATFFIRILFYNKLHNPTGDLYPILFTLFMTVVGIILIMTANSGNFNQEITNPNPTDFILKNDI